MQTHPQIISDLIPCENVVWAEKPSWISLVVQKNNLVELVILFVIALLIRSMPDFPVWFGLLIGAFIVYSIISSICEALGTYYAITDRRLIIYKNSFASSAIESYYPQDVDFIKKQRRKNGSGSICFTALKELGRKGQTRVIEIGFFGIKDVDSVEVAILTLRNEEKENGA